MVTEAGNAHVDPPGGDASLLGRTVAGKFVIDKFLGGGAMGAVYRAHWTALEKNVAIKVMHRAIAIDPSYTSRFSREAKAAARLDHPNSIRIIDSGEESDGLLYIAMEYVEGRDLYRVIHEDWPIANADIVDVLAQALAAIAVAHEMGVIHRDLKPENLMILPGRNDGEEGRYVVKVCDFGIAKLTDKNGKSEASVVGTNLTAGLVVGTPEYMSPEQAKGEKLDARSDIYALGIMLYQLLTGRTPFSGDSPLAVVLQHITNMPEPPHVIYAGVHKGLEAICMKAIAKERDARYQSAREMRSALRSVLEARPAPVEILAPTMEAPPEVSASSASAANAAALDAPELAASVPTGTPAAAVITTAPPATRDGADVAKSVAASSVAPIANPPAKSSRLGVLVGVTAVALIGAVAVLAQSRSGASNESTTESALPSNTVPSLSAPSGSAASSAASPNHSAGHAAASGTPASSGEQASPVVKLAKATSTPTGTAGGAGTAGAKTGGAVKAGASDLPSGGGAPGTPGGAASSTPALTTPAETPSANLAKEPAAPAKESPTAPASPPAAAPTAAPTGPAPFNAATCKAVAGTPKSNGAVNAKDLRMTNTQAAWTACAQRIKDKPAGDISASVHLRFKDNRAFQGASCTNCPAPVAACIAQSTGRTVALAFHGGDVTGEPAFDVPVTITCN